MKIIIHGGVAREHNNPETKPAKKVSIKQIVLQSYEYLKSHNAVQSAVYAISLLEDDEFYDAGIGSELQRDGVIRMTAALMDGATHKMSGVMNIEKVRHPIFVAEKLMDYDDRILGGMGAVKFARENGFEEFSTETPQRKKEFLEKVKSSGTGTVGCVVLDADGKLAAATSTGGKGFELPGRISDSGTIAGNFANEFCGVSCTGVGEDIVSGGIAAKIVTRVTDGFSIDKAFQKTFEELEPFNGFAGAIGIDCYGNIFHRNTHPTLVFASYDGEKLSIFE